MECLITRDGFLQYEKILSVEECCSIKALLGESSQVGNRSLLKNEWCIQLADLLLQRMQLSVHNLKPIQCTLFKKTMASNWLVPWHQDRSLPVEAVKKYEQPKRIVRKDGLEICQPSNSVLEKILAVRVHLDRNDSSSGPLKIIPGTHRDGILSKTEINGIRTYKAEHEVLGEVGSAIAMRPLLLHASSKAPIPNGRRTLHFVFINS